MSRPWVVALAALRALPLRCVGRWICGRSRDWPGVSVGDLFGFRHGWPSVWGFGYVRTLLVEHVQGSVFEQEFETADPPSADKWAKWPHR